MGDVEVNVNLASHVKVGDTSGDYRFVLHRGTPSLFGQSPSMNGTEKASVVSQAQQSQSAFESALPTDVKSWYDARGTGVQDAAYYAAKQY